MTARVLRFPTERVRRPEPPVNPGLEPWALWWAATGEWCHLMSAMLRPPR